MQGPEPPPPLAPLWDRVLRARALPPDLDVQLLYVAIRDRLLHPEWEVRLHALRVLADLLPLSGNALDFPFDQVVDNLGHPSPNVRKAALDALKVFCTHCEDPECAMRAILDKCAYRNIRPHSADLDAKANVVTGLVLSIPSVLGILKRRNTTLDMYPIFTVLGDKLFDPLHKDVALRSLLKLRRVLGPRDYMTSFTQLDSQTQDKFRIMCELYDEDSLDVHYGPRRMYHALRDQNNSHLLRISHSFGNASSTSAKSSTDSSSEDSYFVRRDDGSRCSSGFAKVIIETEIKFDSDTAITMTVLEENETETESDRNLGSEEDGDDSSDRNMLKYSDGESEDTDVVVSQKRVRFGGESFKIRTPDSENMTSDNVNSEDDNKPIHHTNEIDETDKNSDETSLYADAVVVTNKFDDVRNSNTEDTLEAKVIKKSGIPLPVIQTKVRIEQTTSTDFIKPKNITNQKSRSLSELYDYFRKKNGGEFEKLKETSGLALTISEVRTPEKVPSPVELHREIEVLHNLQRSPVLSPRKRKYQLEVEEDGFVLNVLATSPPEFQDLLSPVPSSQIQPHYEWEDYGILPNHVIEQLHNTDNWISAVKAADLLHSALLDADNVKKIEPVAESLIEHMWALSDTVKGARAPAEGAVCAVVRSAGGACARRLLSRLVARLCARPAPAALPHALLQRLALHQLVDLILDYKTSTNSERVESAQLRGALCAARAAGPAAVLAAVRRRLAGSARADIFCDRLRNLLNKPLENGNQQHIARSSHLPVPVRRRARSTPPPAGPAPPRRLRPLPDSAPLPGISKKDVHITLLSPIPLSDRAALRTRGGIADTAAADMLALCCCYRPAVRVAPALPADTPDLVADLPLDTRDSSAATVLVQDTEKAIQTKVDDEKIELSVDSVENYVEDKDEHYEQASRQLPSPALPRSPSLHVDESSPVKSEGAASRESGTVTSSGHGAGGETVSGERSSLFGSRGSLQSAGGGDQESGRGVSAAASSTPSSPGSGRRSVRSRDVRAALTECVLPAKHEDWEAVVGGLEEAARLAGDGGARAPAAGWRAAARAAAQHARSPRSRVARAACTALGALFVHRGRALEPALQEAAGALLDRSADVNRFLRADAAAALGCVARGSDEGRVAGVLAKLGSGHRAAPARAAAASALCELVRAAGARRALSLPADSRAALLRTAGELLADANPEARAAARRLCAALAQDSRFVPLLKECMPAARYRAVEKNVEKLRGR